MPNVIENHHFAGITCSPLVLYKKLSDYDWWLGVVYSTSSGFSRSQDIHIPNYILCTLYIHTYIHTYLPKGCRFGRLAQFPSMSEESIRLCNIKKPRDITLPCLLRFLIGHFWLQKRHLRRRNYGMPVHNLSDDM